MHVTQMLSSIRAFSYLVRYGQFRRLYLESPSASTQVLLYKTYLI